MDLIFGGLQHTAGDFAMKLTYHDANADWCVVQLACSAWIRVIFCQRSANPAVVGK